MRAGYKTISYNVEDKLARERLRGLPCHVMPAPRAEGFGAGECHDPICVESSHSGHYVEKGCGERKSGGDTEQLEQRAT